MGSNFKILCGNFFKTGANFKEQSLKKKKKTVPIFTYLQYRFQRTLKYDTRNISKK